MVKFLEDLGMKWVAGIKYPDYYPEKPGGKIGRSIEGEFFDARSLGMYEHTQRVGDMKAPIPLYSGKVASLPKAFTNIKDFVTVVGMFVNGFKYKIKGAHAVSIGGALTARLLKIVLDLDIPLWLSTPLKDVIIDNDKVVGIEIEKEGKQHFIKCKAVILAAGGFERNPELRKKIP